ncbi:MAG: hypothetical protein PWR20_1614 [Bacteroidales bacterium]|jgi:hypothetical protein|nr:hypothetical protein [Bacteroidales bacterium]MDN5330731.1 hypothetical protein [Bacteroidales bacterium]
MGALKQDSLNNKVYFIPVNQSNDTLLYDYNLKIGDTLEGYLTNGCIMAINAIDSVLVGDHYRKRWNFNTCNEGAGYIIQGMGSDNGLIEKINYEGFCSSQFICIKGSNDSLFAGNSSAMGCYRIFTKVSPIYHEEIIRIYFNTVSSQLILQSEQYLNDAVLTVYNSFGQVLR